MPKESVYGKRMLDNNQVPVAEVRWDREIEFVQLVSRDRVSEVPHPEEQLPEIPARFGYYVELDRRSINELIRNLRRARDQTFGRDE